MPNLVGIGNSQVPTNSMLGGLAYQDPEHVNLTDVEIEKISAIKARTEDTAVDIFVYDTRKDSDGGAWRKRTQKTSWYNETLGTSIRGHRKEFPAVAVIVAELTKLTIYDGDDPNLPMWMVFDLSGSVGSACNMLSRGGSGTESDITSVACLNAKLIVGLKDTSGSVGEGVVDINFISDFGRVYRESGSGFTAAIYNLAISGRNSSGAYSGDFNSLAIVAQTINDVAMTVLPNAPIDDDTGLPVPTIAVATDGGLTIIRDNGFSCNYTRSGGNEIIGTVAFDENNDVIVTWGTSGSGHRHIARFTYPFNGDTSFDTTCGYLASEHGLGASAAGGGSGAVKVSNNGRHFAINHDGQDGNNDDRLGLLKITDNINARSVVGNGTTFSSLGAYITSSYNTGWMPGDIRGAWLSDTSTTDATRTNLISNGTFASNTTGWTGSNATLSVVNNRMKIETDNQGYAHTNFTTVVGEQYVLTFDIHADGNSNGWVILSSTTHGTSNPDLINANPIGEDQTDVGFTFTATTTTTTLTLRVSTSGSGKHIHVDNVSCTLAETDRSPNEQGLKVLGTVPKQVVATGADLVSYGPFSTTNHFHCPMNHSGFSNFNNFKDFGTGPFYFMAWVNISDYTTSDCLVSLWNGADSDENRCAWFLNNSDGHLSLYQKSAAGDGSVTSTIAVPLNQWTHCVTVRDTNTVHTYVNGVEHATTHAARDMDQNTMAVNVGTDRTGLTGAEHTKMSLLRIGKGRISREQVMTIYHDEEQLFKSNAKCTLYGSSDTVTAVAYDDANDIVHAGTSAGRSEFSGLRRINNTTTAVTTAISASNGLVAEQ